MKRLSVALVSLMPPVRSGIADYTADLLPALSALVDVKLYAPAEASASLRAAHDVWLFQIGNDPRHEPSIEALRDRARGKPAVVVLHDFVLHHLFAAAYLGGGRLDDYERELIRSHGERGRELAQRSRSGQVTPVWDDSPWSYPLSAGVIRDADAVVVHSRLARGAVLREEPLTHVVEIPLLVARAPWTPRDVARRALSLPLDRTVAVTLGLVTPAKRVSKILDALALLPKEIRPLLFVGGEVAPEDPLRARVADLGLEDDVVIAGYLSDEDFWRAARAADISINLRHPTMGETSAAVCRLAGIGLPIIVSDVGWFRELPDSFTSKIPVGEDETKRLAEELSRLASDESERLTRAALARAWGEERRPEHVAEAYAQVLEDTALGLPRPLALSGAIASELFALGVGRAGHLGATSREPDARLVIETARLAADLLLARVATPFRGTRPTAATVVVPEPDGP